MSVVTTVVLSVHSSDMDNVTRLNDLVNRRLGPSHQSYYHLESLTERHEIWGGSKAPQADIFGGAFNHLRIDEYLACFAEIAWQSPDDLRLLVKGEYDDSFAVYVRATFEAQLERVA